MATRRRIVITQQDREQLYELLETSFATSISDRCYLEALRDELSLARVVDADAVPHDVVTMNSTVRLRDIAAKEEDIYTLVYPDQANIAEGRLSILAPIGTAILGYRAGDVVRWDVPSGMVRMRIEELIFQPERNAVLA